MSARAVHAFSALGTSWTIETALPLPQEVRTRIAATVEDFDRTWSRFRPDSLVTALRGGGVAELPADATDMLDLYAELDGATDGAVNPLVGDALSALGYDADLTLRPGATRGAPFDWQDILTWDGQLRQAAPGTIDVGALGKGRLVDLLHGIVARAMAGPVVVDGSGDIRSSGGTERIALEHPYDPARAIGIATITDAALCASATTRRAWGDGLHHVLDARTGAPVRTVVATWAIAPEAMRADALATALFFEGGARLAARHGVDWVRMLSDGRVEYAPDSRIEVFA